MTDSCDARHRQSQPAMPGVRRQARAVTPAAGGVNLATVTITAGASPPKSFVVIRSCGKNTTFLPKIAS